MPQRKKRTKWVQLDLYDVYAYERVKEKLHEAAQAKTAQQIPQREEIPQPKPQNKSG